MQMVLEWQEVDQWVLGDGRDWREGAERLQKDTRKHSGVMAMFTMLIMVMFIRVSKLNTLYNLNICSLWFINHTPIKLLKKSL